MWDEKWGWLSICSKSSKRDRDSDREWMGEMVAVDVGFLCEFTKGKSHSVVYIIFWGLLHASLCLVCMFVIVVVAVIAVIIIVVDAIWEFSFFSSWKHLSIKLIFLFYKRTGLFFSFFLAFFLLLLCVVWIFGNSHGSIKWTVEWGRKRVS